MAIFNAEIYQRYRPQYPAETFSELHQFLKMSGTKSPWQVADIAAGTGNASISLLNSGISARILAVEPSAEMLERARKSEILQSSGTEFFEGTGEATGLADQSVHALMVASAFHWMDPVRAKEEFLRILKPPGALLIFEYQFPKSLTNPAVNDFIRKNFNLHWKAPGQKPRGTFRELTQDLRQDFRLLELSFKQVAMILELNVHELFGLLISQSRVLHYEQSLSKTGVISFREKLFANLRNFLGEDPSVYDFKLTVACFKLR